VYFRSGNIVLVVIDAEEDVGDEGDVFDESSDEREEGAAVLAIMLALTLLKEGTLLLFFNFGADIGLPTYTLTT
jgi:hypothetical protein